VNESALELAFRGLFAFLACYRGGFLLNNKIDPLAGTKILVQAALRRKRLSYDFRPGFCCGAASRTATLLSSRPPHKGKRRTAQGKILNC
jgi:hypothetical protein